MSYVLGFGGQKGGSGKTVLATSSAVCASQVGEKVIIYDLDNKQKSSVMWLERREKEHNNDKTPITVKLASRDSVPSCLNGEDISILDLPGFADQETAEVARHCHLFVLPTGTGLDDLDPTIKIAHELVTHGVSQERIYFAIMKAPNSKQAQKAREYIQDAGYNVLKGFSRFATSIEHARDKGLGITEIPYAKLRHEAQDLVEDIGFELLRERNIESKKDYDLDFYDKEPQQQKKGRKR